MIAVASAASIGRSRATGAAADNDRDRGPRPPFDRDRPPVRREFEDRAPRFDRDDRAPRFDRDASVRRAFERDNDRAPRFERDKDGVTDSIAPIVSRSDRRDRRGIQLDRAATASRHIRATDDTPVDGCGRSGATGGSHAAGRRRWLSLDGGNRWRFPGLRRSAQRHEAPPQAPRLLPQLPHARPQHRVRLCRARALNRQDISDTLRVPRDYVRAWTAAFAFGFMSHLLGDACTRGGIQPGLPFTRRRVWVLPRLFRGKSVGWQNGLAQIAAVIVLGISLAAYLTLQR